MTEAAGLSYSEDTGEMQSRSPETAAGTLFEYWKGGKEHGSGGNGFHGHVEEEKGFFSG